MINLLPPEEKKIIGKEYKHRVFVTYLIFLTAGLIVSLILLLPSYFVMNVVVNELEDEAAFLENSNESTEMEKINAELRLTKERLRAVTINSKRVEFYEIIEKISIHKPRAVTLNNFSYTKGIDGKESKLLLGGNASTRDSLLLFTKDIENDELFDEVVLPVSSLAKEKDIDFSLEIKGNF
jgi:hypothetical protein